MKPKHESPAALRARWDALGTEAVPGSRSWFAGEHLRQGAPSPFGSVSGREDFRGVPLAEALRLSDCRLCRVNFTAADLRGLRLTGAGFDDCVFDAANLSAMRQWRSTFEDCTFVRTDLSDAAFGADGAHYRRCLFDRAVFTGASFIRPEFSECSFQSCKLKGTDFNMSRFEQCSFSGKLSDVRFNGNIDDALRVKAFGRARPNEMCNVDFSEAVFDYVSFDNGCDLSTVVLPSDGWHVLLTDMRSALRCIESKLCEPRAEKLAPGAAIWVPLLRGFSAKQNSYIVSGHDFKQEGEEFAEGFLELLRNCSEGA